MPELRLNEENQLVDDSGNVVSLEGEPITVIGASRQEEVDAAFQREKTKHQTKIRDLTERIKVLEAQANRTEEVQGLLDTLKAEKGDLETKLADAEKDAENKVASQLRAAKENTDKLMTALESERTARISDQVSTAILSAARGVFTDPGTDILPHLLNAHVREPKKDAHGNSIEGEYQDFFKLSYKKDDGQEVSEALPIDKALEVWASQHPHHVKPTNRSGSGGGVYSTGNFTNLKRSQMSVEQKSEFIDKHGPDAFKSLPQ